MKNLHIILFGLITTVLVVSCSEELLVDETIDGVVNGGVLRNLGVTNNLDSADMSSTYSIILEAQDGQNGNLLKEVRVNVGFNDVDDMGTDTVAMSSFATIPASAFNETSPTTNGLPVTTFTATLMQLVNHVGTSPGNFSVDDGFVIDFEMELTDGRVFNFGNATGDVTRTGRFSYFNAQFRYTATINDPNRITVEDLSIAGTSSGRLKNGSMDTVFVTFDRSSINTLPTVTPTSTGGNTDGSVGPVTLWDDEDNKDDEIYFFLYTAGAADTDTVGFVVSDAVDVSGFPSYPDTLKGAFIIDNVIEPTLTTTSSIENDKIASISLIFDFAEELSADSITFNVDGGGMFDDFIIKQKVSKGDESSTLTFSPMSGGNLLDLQNLNFDVELGGAKDIAGNELAEVVSVDVF